MQIRIEFIDNDENRYDYVVYDAENETDALEQFDEEFWGLNLSIVNILEN